MRALLGVLLILHGLAHAGAGMWAAGPVWLVTLLLWLATTLYVAAGFGVLGFKYYRRGAPELTFAALVPSALLLGAFVGWFVLIGVALDLGLLLWTVRISEPADRAAPRWGRVATTLGATFIVYVSAVVLLRPWAMRLGTTPADRAAVLFGDSLNPTARYLVDNAVTIHAPADSVWPWIAQMGQDRGGFYSYDWLERAFGARIHNADTIVPAWQERQLGELVRAVQPGYLGGVFGNEVGWRIVAIDPGHALVLDNWGAFIVRPIDEHTSQLYIRQRNPGTPSLTGTLLAPVGLLVFEPAHFIMQHGMLRGVKRRAERPGA